MYMYSSLLAKTSLVCLFDKELGFLHRIMCYIQPLMGSWSDLGPAKEDKRRRSVITHYRALLKLLTEE